MFQVLTKIDFGLLGKNIVQTYFPAEGRGTLAPHLTSVPRLYNFLHLFSASFSAVVLSVGLPAVAEAFGQSEGVPLTRYSVPGCDGTGGPGGASLSHRRRIASSSSVCGLGTGDRPTAQFLKKCIICHQKITKNETPNPKFLCTKLCLRNY